MWMLSFWGVFDLLLDKQFFAIADVDATCGKTALCRVSGLRKPTQYTRRRKPYHPLEVCHHDSKSESHFQRWIIEIRLSFEAIMKNHACCPRWDVNLYITVSINDRNSFECTAILLQFSWISPSIVLVLSFVFAEPFLWLACTELKVQLKCRALNENIASPRCRNAERSPFR